MPVAHHRYATVEGHQLFYREATIVLLHGFPTSSFMFRNLIPALADGYHVVSPDLLGFGLSDAPSADSFDYTFDALARLTAGLLEQLDISSYAIYVQDYGAPIGWRLALQSPEAITATVTQNGNGYEAGVRSALTLEATKWQYLTGVPDESVVSPDTWHHDCCPGRATTQLALFGEWGAGPRGLGPGRRDLRSRRGAPSPVTLPRRRSTCSTQATSCRRVRATR